MMFNAKIPGRRTIGPHVSISATILGLGGIRTHLLLLCGALRKHHVAVTLFATGSNWDRGSLLRLSSLNVKLHLPPPPLRSAHKLASLYSILSWPVLVPRCTNSVYCIGAGQSHFLMHRLKPKATLSINHEIVAPPSADSPAGQCAGFLDASIANSRKVAELMRGYWPQKPIRVIPFLTSDRQTPAPFPRPAVASGTLRVTYLGRLVEQKRPDQLVKRWKELSHQPGLAPARLDVYGNDPDGGMFSSLRAFVAANQLTDTVAIHGEYSLQQLPGILENSDIVVLPSLWEGLPLVLVEAMLKGVPFVATAAGGTEELGLENPDVTVTATEWADFERGLVEMGRRVRAGKIDLRRLHRWAEARYGYDAVSCQWLKCLLSPRDYFSIHA